MRNLTELEISEVSGSGIFHLGAVIAACVLAGITTGPVGVGYVLSTAVMAKGIDNLEDLINKQ